MVRFVGGLHVSLCYPKIGINKNLNIKSLNIISNEGSNSNEGGWNAEIFGLKKKFSSNKRNGYSDVGDIMIVTDFKYWWQNHFVGDILSLTSVTDIDEPYDKHEHWSGLWSEFRSETSNGQIPGQEFRYGISGPAYSPQFGTKIHSWANDPDRFGFGSEFQK